MMAKDLKRIVFEDTDKRHADLKIRLDYDGISQALFFRSLITGYLEKNEHMIKFIEEVQERNNIHSQQKRIKSAELREKGKQTIKNFGLDEEEVEDIFDLLEKEHPEL